MAASRWHRFCRIAHIQTPSSVWYRATKMESAVQHSKQRLLFVDIVLALDAAAVLAVMAVALWQQMLRRSELQPLTKIRSSLWQRKVKYARADVAGVEA